MATHTRLGARGSRIAKRKNRDERNRDSLYDRGVLSRPEDVRAKLDSKLNASEVVRFGECETIIERGLQTFVEVGNALLTIRDNRLYREQFSTFEDYCKERWQLKQSRAYQFMDAAEVIAHLKSSTIVELPANEAQVRPLTALEPDKQVEAWQTAVETAPNGRLTAAHVQTVVDGLNGKHDDTEADEPFVSHVVWEREPLDPEIAQRQRLASVVSRTHPDVRGVIEKYGVVDFDTIELLTEGHAQGREWFNEVRDSGYVQPGNPEDACHITASAYRVKLSIEKRGENHKIIALDTKKYREEMALVDRATNARKSLHSSEETEWYTPAQYVEAARRVMGGIDLDPASSAIANDTVKAARFFDIEADGLNQTWEGRVWLNPPYGKEDNGESNQAVWSARLLSEYQVGRVTEAVLLVNATTDRKWFAPLWDYLICFTNHRIRFYRVTGEADSPTHGNAFIYLGANRDRFIEVFREFGVIVTEAVR